MSSLLERARELRRLVRETGHSKGTLSAKLYMDLTGFFEDVAPVLEQQNKWAILHAQNVALKAELSQLKSYDEEAKRGIQYTDQAEVPPPRIDFYPEAKAEARERRVMAIAQMAAVLYGKADMGCVDAVTIARGILAEVEKEPGK